MFCNGLGLFSTWQLGIRPQTLALGMLHAGPKCGAPVPFSYRTSTAERALGPGKSNRLHRPYTCCCSFRGIPRGREGFKIFTRVRFPTHRRGSCCYSLRQRVAIPFGMGKVWTNVPWEGTTQARVGAKPSAIDRPVGRPDRVDRLRPPLRTGQYC